jgi:hypothetical protein
MRVRGWLSWLLLLLCGLAISPTAQAQGEAKAFIDDVKTKLAKGLEHLTGQNYREIKREPVQAPREEQVEKDSSRSVSGNELRHRGRLRQRLRAREDCPA